MPTVPEDARAIGAIGAQFTITAGAWAIVVSLRGVSGSSVAPLPLGTQLRAFAVAMFTMSNGFITQDVIARSSA